MSIVGLLPSNNSITPNTVLNFTPGHCRDKDNSIDLNVAVGWTKSTAVWAAGSGAGMLDTGTVLANKGYHLFVIYDPTADVYDYLCSLSATAPMMPAGFTKRCRIHSFVTDAGGEIKRGIWYPNGEFRLASAINVVSAAAGNFQTLKGLPVPLGVKLKVFGQVYAAASPDCAFWIIIRDPDLGTLADVPEQWYDAQFYKKLGPNDGGPFESWTDTTGQIYHLAYPRTATNLIYIYLQGWFDPREEFC